MVFIREWIEMKFKDVELFVLSHSFFSHKTITVWSPCPCDEALYETFNLSWMSAKLRLNVWGFFLEGGNSQCYWEKLDDKELK